MNTKQYINYFCTPTIYNVSIIDYENMTSQSISFEAIRYKLLKLDYKDYLQTRYWKCISLFLRNSFKKCKCGSSEKLHVHHKTYKYVGIDHEHLNILQVMCEYCHCLEHRKAFAPCSNDKGKGYVVGKENSNIVPYNLKKQMRVFTKCK
jgi:hypothetical protein